MVSDLHTWYAPIGPTGLGVILAIAEGAMIFGAYAAVFVSIGAYSVWVVRRGRQLAEEVDDDRKYWS